MSPEDFQILRVHDGLIDPTLLSDVRFAGLRSGITIAV